MLNAQVLRHVIVPPCKVSEGLSALYVRRRTEFLETNVETESSYEGWSIEWAGRVSCMSVC